MKPHEIYDITNRIMFELPPEITAEEMRQIGVSLVARAQFIIACRDLSMIDVMQTVLDSAKKGQLESSARIEVP